MKSLNEAYMILVLDSTFQSYGVSSRFSERTTLSYPSKSAIDGMICSALGIGRGDVKEIAKISSLTMDVVCFSKNGRIIKDYQTIGGGYDRNDEIERTFIPTMKNGKIRPSGGEIMITRRDYLCGFRFCVIATGDKEILKKIGVALRNPKWNIYLGRKKNVPCDIIFREIVATKKEVSDYVEKYAISKEYNLEESLVIVDGLGRMKDCDSSIESLIDKPLNFETGSYASRKVEIVYAPIYFKEQL